MNRYLQPQGYGLTRPGSSPGQPFSAPVRGPLNARVTENPTMRVDVPMEDATWVELLEQGCGVVYHLVIDGIPYVFSERELEDVFGRAVRSPTSYTTSHALFIHDAIDLSQDADRQKGLAAGRAADFVLERGALEVEGVAAALMRVPTLRAALASSVTSAHETQLTVDDTTGFVAGTGYYLGHEYLIPNGLTSTTFEGVQRGICGRPHYHLSQSGSGYRYVTDAPMFWRGRRAVLWEMLVGPDGAAFSTDYATLGPFCRQKWKGYLDADLELNEVGFVARCLPLPRLLAEEIGVKLRGTINFDDQGFPYPIGFGQGDQIRIRETAGSGLDVIGPNQPGTTSFELGSIQTWCAIAQQNIGAGSGSDEITIKPILSQWAIRIKARFFGETAHDFYLFAGCWFMRQDSYDGHGNALRAEVDVPLDMGWKNGWLPVLFEAGEDGSIADLPAAGMGVIEVGEQREVVAWDEVRYLDAQDATRPVALRLSARRIGSPAVLDWTQGGSFTVVAGSRGSWRDVFRTLVTSSGLQGARGPFDTLPFGFGLGLDDDDIDINSLALVGASHLEALAEDKTSVADLLCGWAALHRLCVVQRRGLDGVVRLTVVSTDPTDDPSGTVLGMDDVLIGGHRSPARIDAPNVVRIEAGSGAAARTYVARDLARVQMERGARSWSLKAPGIPEVRAITLGGRLLQLSDGQATVELIVPEHVGEAVQMGDAAVLETAHPQVYDWTTGAWAPESISARVVGWGHKPVGGHRLTLLLPGQAQAALLLAPSPVLSHAVIGSTTIRLRPEDARWFGAGDAVVVYDPGRRGDHAFQCVIDDIWPGETQADEWGVVLDTTVPSWVTPGVTRITFDEYANCSTRQRTFMFVRTGKNWD